MNTCPITKKECNLIPECVLFDGTGSTYCVEWIKKHRAIGAKILTSNKAQIAGHVTIYEELAGNDTFYFIYDRAKDNIREFAEKQLAINWCIDRKLNYSFEPISL